MINAHHVILALAVLFILFGGWRLVSSEFEPVSLLTFGIGVVLAAGTLGRMRKERTKSHGDKDHAG